LRELLSSLEVARPTITLAARECLGETAALIDQFGVPANQADWFAAVSTVDVLPEARGCMYMTSDQRVTIAGAAVIGRSPFGSIVVDCDSGHVVYCDTLGTSQLLNSSYGKFLFFVGRLHRSDLLRFADVDDLHSSLQVVDPVALKNPEGIWSVTLEEAQAGLY
jgi:hypothetical protein